MTSIGAVKEQLVTVLAAALPDAQVLPGPVGETTLTGRVVEVGSRSTAVQYQVTAIDGSTGAATYTLMVTCSVSSAGTDGTTVEDLALADFAASVAAIQTDETLTLPDVAATVDGNGELVEYANQSGRSAAMRFPVVVFTTL